MILHGSLSSSGPPVGLHDRFLAAHFISNDSETTQKFQIKKEKKEKKREANPGTHSTHVANRIQFDITNCFHIQIKKIKKERKQKRRKTVKQELGNQRQIVNQKSEEVKRRCFQLNALEERSKKKEKRRKEKV